MITVMADGKQFMLMDNQGCYIMRGEVSIDRMVKFSPDRSLWRKASA